MKTILIISFSELHRDPRVLRQIKSLYKSYRIIAAGYTDPNFSGMFENFEITWLPIAKESMTILDIIKKVYQLKFRRFATYYSELTPVSSFMKNKLPDFDLIISNDLDSLPLSLSIARNRPVYLDAHEYAPEEHSNIIWKFLFSDYVFWLCRKYLNQASVISTVGSEIARKYHTIFNVQLPAVIPNASEFHSLSETEVNEVIHLVHHGGVQKGRGLNDLIELMKLLDARFVLHFYLLANSSSARKYLFKLKKNARILGNRIIFHPPVKMSEIPATINKYDMGVYLLQPLSYNNEMALPNKLFEFIQARLAIATGPSFEMAKIVSKYNIGVVSDNFSATSLAHKINHLSKQEIFQMKLNSNKAASELCFETFSRLLLDIIDSLLNPVSVEK